jgi:hypothetical protein
VEGPKFFRLDRKSVSGVAVSVAHFVAVEFSVSMFGVVLSALRIGAVIAVMGIVAVVYVTPEVFGAVIPRAGSDKDAA